MSLREELAQRLATEAFGSGKVEDMLEVQQELWGRVAAEVIRQMEWARHDGYGPGFKHGREYEAAGFPECNGLVDRDQFDDFPLTLAPPDWKP